MLDVACRLCEYAAQSTHPQQGMQAAGARHRAPMLDVACRLQARDTEHQLVAADEALARFREELRLIRHKKVRGSRASWISR